MALHDVRLKFINLYCVSLVCVWNSLALAYPLSTDSLTAKVDSLFAEWNKPDSPGCALALIKYHEMIYARGYGSANLEYNLPITSKSVFRIGSTSKQFTAMCILLLAEQGKLALDDDIRKHVPEMPDYGTPIIISHLIHHTSGIRDYLTLMELAGLRNDDFLIDKMLKQGVLNSGDTLDYAYGLVVSNYKGLKMISHGGAFVGFRAEMIRFPGQKFAVICLANLSAFQPSQLARRVADIYLKNQFTPAVQKEMAETTKPPQFVKLSSSDLQKRVGTYRNPANGRILKIFFENGELTLDAGGENQFHIRPESDTAFRTFEAPVELHIIFEKQTPGKPDLMHVRRAGRQPSTYQAIKVWIPAQTLLDECAGAYFSDELRATYHVVVKDGGLYLVHENPHKNYPKEALEPTLQDMFYVAGIEVKFTRNAQAQLSGLTLNTGRVKNIQFVKK